MENKEKAIEYLEKHIPELAEAAVKQAYWQTLALGDSIMISDNSAIREIFPDGTSNIIEENKPFIKVQKSQIIN